MTDPLETGRYQLVRRLAVGGMGEVLLAKAAGDERIGLGPGLVVIKRTIPKHPSLEHQNRMLKEEGRIALRLRHANLVETFALDEVEGTPLLVMEYLAGRSMAQVLGAAKRTGDMVATEVALKVIHEAACGLHFAHTLRDGDRLAGLVHRDVSPANVFVTFDGRVKVIDFGVAKADDSEIKTSTGVLKGKIGYMSPEHTLGEKLDPRSDLWSLGVLLWETLVADRLFAHQNPALTLHKINNGEIARPSSYRPDVPDSVDQLVMRLLTRAKEERVASGAELVRLIDAIPDVAWRSVDLGAFLCARFPDEAERGQAEAREAARARGEPVPQGLITGSTASSDTDLDAATVVANRRELIELAKSTLGQKTGPVGGAAVPSAHYEDDEVARTTQLSAEEVAAIMGLAPPSASAAPPRDRAGRDDDPGRTLPLMGPGGSAPPPISADDPIAATIAQAVPLELLGTLPETNPDRTEGDDSAIATQSSPGKLSADRSLGDAAGEGETASARPQGARGPRSAPAESSGEIGARAEPSGPSTASAGRARPGSGPQVPPKAAPRRRSGPSAAAVALGTFGLLASVMGLVFTLLRPDTEPTYYAWPGPDGTEVVTGRIDVPDDAALAYRRVLNPAAPQLVVAAGKGAILVDAGDLEAKLESAGVAARALLPHSPRAQLAAAQPPHNLLLGLLALAFAGPGFVLRGASALITRVVLVVGAATFAGWTLLHGLLSWPGTETLKAPPARLLATTVRVATPSAPANTPPPAPSR